MMHDMTVMSVAPLDLPELTELKIAVTSKYLAGYNIDSKHTFSYKVDMENTSCDTWRLISRHWEVLDASGRQFTIDGEGVVGSQPFLAPRSKYSYESLVSINDCPGIMHGYYVLQNAWGDLVHAPIPAFRLGQIDQGLLN